MIRLNLIIVKILLGFSCLLLLFSCNSNEKNKVDSEKNMESLVIGKPEIPRKTKITRNSNIDTIVINGMEFHPAELKVKKGDTVVWINKDIVVHDVTEFPDKKWTSGPLESGKSWQKIVENDFNYFCSIHITMKGKINVDK